MLENPAVGLAGRRVLPVALGAARWSLGEPLRDREALAIVEHALEQGISCIDTARAYTTRHEETHNERLIGRVLRVIGTDEMLVCTKGGHYRDGDHWPVDARPERLRADVRASLRALGVESIGLYYLHFPDPAVPIEDSLGALSDARAAGEIRHIGLSNVTEEQLRDALAVTGIDAVQNRFSPFSDDQDEVIALCQERGIPFLASSPLGGTAPPRPLGELSPTAVRIAADAALPVETILLSWLLSVAPGMLLITGARRRESLRSSAAAARLRLDPAQSRAISAELTESRKATA